MNSEAVKFDLNTLDSILEQERSALLNGEIEELQTLAEGKNRLLSALENSDPISAGQIIPLKQKLRRNKALIESALEGIQAVASRIEDTRQLKKVMHTYDQQGEKRKFDQDQKEVSKCARETVNWSNAVYCSRAL